MSASIEKFLSALKQSGLVEEDALQAEWKKFSSEPQVPGNAPPTAEEFADYLVEQGLITNWHAAKLLKGKHKGFFLGKYKLLRLLGKGGMSSVYLAEHVVMKRRTAVKVLPYKLVSNSSYLPRFYREAQAVAALDDPNIVRAYDVDHVTDGKMEIHFLVMEYVPGQNFYELVKSQGPLDPRKAADYIRQGALGLEHAHQAGMVHRDVKPGNFIVDENGTVKLMDLGLAMVNPEPGEHSVTVANEEKVLGTADYLAPEQAVDSHLVDHRADIYALGCTFYFLLAGQPPFDKGTLAQRLLAHQNKEAPPLSNFRNDIPPCLDDIIHRMMLKDPEERTQTAAQVADELKNWLENPNTPVIQNKNQPPLIVQDTDSQRNREESGAISDFLSHLQDSESSSGSKTPQPALKKTPSPPKEHSNVKAPNSSELSESAINVLSSGPSSIVTHQASSHAQRKELRKRMGVSPLFVGLLCVAIFAGIMVIYSLSKPKENTSETSPQETLGENATTRKNIPGPIIKVGPQGDFRKINEAISYLNEESSSSSTYEKIVVASGQTLEETIQIHTGFGNFPTPFIIEGEGPDFPILKAKNSFAVDLHSVENLTISNLVIDCSESQTGIKVSGYLTGTVFENLQITKIKETGILASGARGLSTAPLLFHNCQFTSASDTSTGLRFTDSETFDTSQVKISKCQFIGPMSKGILFSNDTGITSDIEIVECLFHKTHSGIGVSGNSHETSRFKVANNTFHDLTRGMNFESGPTPSSTGNTFFQNLFVNVSQAEVSVSSENVSPSEFNQSAIPIQNNISTSPPKDVASWLNIFETNGKTNVSEIEFKSTDPNSPDFLKPVSTPTLIPSAPIDGRNFIGAVSP